MLCSSARARARNFFEAPGVESEEDLTDNFRRAASYVDRILKGEKPADLPVQQPTRLEMVIRARRILAPHDLKSNIQVSVNV